VCIREKYKLDENYKILNDDRNNFGRDGVYYLT
jgi:hypothetical protein